MHQQIFDEELFIQRRRRSSAYWPQVDFLWKYFAQNIYERVYDTLETYEQALDIGSRFLYVSQAFQDNVKVKSWDTQEISGLKTPLQASIISDHPQFKKNHYNLATSLLNMHHFNDIQGALQTYHGLLKPGGLFIANFFGENNLTELRQALYQAEQEVLGGISPRISPSIRLKDAGNLLFMAGFKLPVADKEILTLNYKNPQQLLKDIQYMGESNLLIQRSKILKKPKAFIHSLYQKLQDIAGSDDGSLNMTCEVITITGWKSDGSMDPKTGRSTI